MKPIIINGKKVYRSEDGNNVKFVGSEKEYSEICVEIDDRREVEEVEDGSV